MVNDKMANRYIPPRAEIISLQITPAILSTSGDYLPTYTIAGGSQQFNAW